MNNNNRKFNKLVIWSIILMNISSFVWAEEYNDRYDELKYGVWWSSRELIKHYRVLAKGIINDTKVRVRSSPIVTKGNIIGEGYKKQRVMVLGKSTIIDTIGEDRARWLLVEWKEGRGWIYGVYIDLVEREMTEVPVMVALEEGTMEPDFDVRSEELAIQDFDEIIRRYEQGITGDTPIIGRSYRLMEDTVIKEFSTRSRPGSESGVYKHVYGSRIVIGEYVYKDYMILLLKEHYSDFRKIHIQFVLDYKVIPNPQNKYSTESDSPSGSSGIKIAGKHRESNFPTIVLILRDGDKKMDYGIPRNDIVEAYLTDIGKKRLIKMKEKNMEYIRYNFPH